MNENRNIKCAPSDRNQSWTSIDWNKAEEAVKKLQARIVKAQKDGKYGKVVSYNRLVELEREVAVPLILFIKKVLLGKYTGIKLC